MNLLPLLTAEDQGHHHLIEQLFFYDVIASLCTQLGSNKNPQTIVVVLRILESFFKLCGRAMKTEERQTLTSACSMRRWRYWKTTAAWNEFNSCLIFINKVLTFKKDLLQSSISSTLSLKMYEIFVLF